MEPVSLPLDYAAIERILPHRYPFLLVDRIIAFEPDKRIVGVKNVSINERYLSPGGNAAAALPPTILTEAVAQVGAILSLSKPENRNRLIFFMGIEKAKFRQTVVPGDQLVIECEMVHARDTACKVKAVAKVDDRVVTEATMTFSLLEIDPVKSSVGGMMG